jgi:hypothetical protein
MAKEKSSSTSRAKPDITASASSAKRLYMYQTQCPAHELTHAKKVREQKCRKNYRSNFCYNSFRCMRVKEDLAKSKESKRFFVLTLQK